MALLRTHHLIQLWRFAVVLATLMMLLLNGRLMSCDAFPHCDIDDFHGLKKARPGHAVCAAQDRHALLRFKASISADPNNTLSDWLPSNPNCCHWNGVTCDGVTGRVVHLLLSRKSFQGKLAPELGSLSSLRVLCLSENSFSGRIPSSFGQLKDLALMDLESNSLSGPLPATIGGMTSLQVLNLEDNKISGLPPSFGLLSSLQVVYLGHNQLSGPIPDGFSRDLKSLTFLFLHNNRITSLPQNMQTAASLQWLALSENPLVHWNAVAGIGTLPLLKQLEMESCNLTGPMPGWVAQIPRPGPVNVEAMASIDLSDNAITGEIPAELGKRTKMESLILRQNKLTGPIPASLVQLRHLVTLDLSENELSGQVPPFSNDTITIFKPGNPDLCGSANLPPCKHI